MSIEPDTISPNTPLRHVLFVLRCTLSAALAYWVAARLGLEYPSWASVSAIIVSQERLSDTGEVALNRLLATILGVVIAVGSAIIIQWLGFGVLVQMALGVAIASAIARRWPHLKVAMWTVPIIYFAGSEPHTPIAFGIWRGAEVLIGGVCGALLHFVVDQIFNVLTKGARPE